MKKTRLGIALLIMLAFVVTTGTFAYWASSVSGDTLSQNNSITIGEGNEVTTTLSLGTLAENGYTLVPTGYQDGTNTYDSTTFTFPVQWDADSAGADSFDGNLAVTFSNKSLGTLTPTEIENMFNFVVTTAPSTLTEGAGTSDVVVTVTFANEPASKSIYDETANGTLTFDVVFTITPQ